MSYEPKEGQAQVGARSHDPHSATRWDDSPPRDRHDFEIAIICALPLEASAVGSLFDKRWDNQTYSKASGDSNAYSTGAIGRHNVVLVHMPNMGKVAAATAATSLRASFPAINLALVVGICGGAPLANQQSANIRLGDVVVSQGLVQYDLGRKFPNGRFVRKDTPHDNLPRPNQELRAVLAKLQTEQVKTWLQNKTSEYLMALHQDLGDTVAYAGATEDRLFNSTYGHRHHKPSVCAICINEDGRDDVCDRALVTNCEQLECDDQELVPRVQPSQPYNPVIHFGLIGSGDTVMKSGEDRDDIATRDGVIAFEMEGAGVWENTLGSLVIKGVCDYADSHKSKRWQGYAAATAAAVTKCFLENWDPSTLSLNTTGPPKSLSRHHTTLRHEETQVGAREVNNNPTGRVAELEILKKLDTSPYRERKDRNPDRIPGTCEWFVGHDLFQDWLESRSSRILWVSADPGCGKSVLAKYLVDSILPTTECRTTCYFFFKDDFEDQRSVVSALSSVLRQLFQHKRRLLSEKIRERFEVDGGKLTSSFSELWDILISATKDKHAGEVICLLDAVDECDDREWSQLAQALCKLYGSGHDFNLKFLITSRPYGDIRRGLQPLDLPELPLIHLSGESDAEVKKISQEIDLFIKARIQNIGAKLKLRHDEQELLLQEFTRVPHRTYLWVHLTLDLVERNVDIDKAGIVEATSRLPNTVDEAYERILSRSRNGKEAKKLLHIIVAAERPLTLKEMSLALALRENHRSYCDLDLKSEERFREYVRDLCGLFVTIINSRIYLLHQTAKEFLVQNNPSEGINRDFEWRYSLIPQESDYILAQICIWHLLFTEFETHPLGMNVESSEYIDVYTDSYAFIDYSARHWTIHLHRSDIQDNIMIKSLLKICDVNSKGCLTWFRIYWHNRSSAFPQNFTMLMIASYFGLRVVVQILLKMNDINLNAQDDTHERSALSWAAGNGFNDIVKLLVKGTMSSWMEITQLSFRRKAQVNSVDRYGRTPLSWAAGNGHEAAVKLLVEKGANLESKDNEFGRTPLLWAACYGHEAVVKLLLKKGANLESKDNESGWTPLSWAACYGHEAVVKLLVEKGADLESKDNLGRTPLSWAAGHGLESVVKLLVEKGADLESKDNLGRTPLSRAACYGHEAVVKLLLEKGADLESKDNLGRTPLLWAAANGHEAVVKLLLEKGADLESKNNFGRTPLSYAAVKGHEAVVKLLLEKGANLESKDNEFGRTPLSYATEDGHEAVVKLLLGKGADLESKNNFGRTPLSWAAGNGHEAVVKLLLEKGANLESKDNEFDQTPLSYATEDGHEAVVKLLLEKGADLESKDNLGRTPLLWAAANGHEAVVKLLLERGAQRSQ